MPRLDKHLDLKKKDLEYRKKNNIKTIYCYTYNCKFKLLPVFIYFSDMVIWLRADRYHHGDVREKCLVFGKQEENRVYQAGTVLCD